MSEFQTPVTFVGSDNVFELQFLHPEVKAVYRAGRILFARYVVMADWWGGEQRQIAVYDLWTIEKDKPVSGEYTVNDPVKVFPQARRVAAEMWARHMVGKH